MHVCAIPTLVYNRLLKKSINFLYIWSGDVRLLKNIDTVRSSHTMLQVFTSCKLFLTPPPPKQFLHESSHGLQGSIEAGKLKSFAPFKDEVQPHKWGNEPAWIPSAACDCAMTTPTCTIIYYHTTTTSSCTVPHSRSRLMASRSPCLHAYRPTQRVHKYNTEISTHSRQVLIQKNSTQQHSQPFWMINPLPSYQFEAEKHIQSSV